MSQVQHFGNHTHTRQTCGPFTTGLPIPVLHPMDSAQSGWGSVKISLISMKPSLIYWFSCHGQLLMSTLSSFLRPQARLSWPRSCLVIHIPRVVVLMFVSMTTGIPLHKQLPRVARLHQFRQTWFSFILMPS
jgi:hypothetical protein